MSPLFDTGPQLVVLMGLFSAPLLARQSHFGAFRRSWALLPACGVALLPALALPLSADTGLALALRISCALMATLPGLLLLKAWLGGRDRELSELFVTLPGLLWLPLLARPLLAPVIPVPAGLAGRAAALGLLLAIALGLGLLLAGLQERFRLNRAPGSIAGLPFRLAVLGLMLVLWQAIERLLAGGGLG
jgi:hypothetical protein